MAWTNQNPYTGKESTFGGMSSRDLAKSNLFDTTIHDRDAADAAFNTYLELLMRDEDFQRSSPQAQVERLMAAGMSRSAALQAIQGSQYTEATPQMAGTVEQNKTARMEAVSSIVGQLGSIVSSVPQFVSNVQQLKYNKLFFEGNLQTVQALARIRNNEATFSDWQLSAQNEQALFDNLLSSYRSAHPDFEQPNSLEELISFGRNLSPDIHDFTANALKAWCDNSDSYLSKPLAYNTFKNAYDGQYASQYYNDVVRRQAFAGAALAEIDVDKAGVEIYEICSRIYKNIQDGKYDNALIDVAEQQVGLYAAQIGLVDAQTENVEAETTLLGIQTKEERLNYEYLKELNPVRIREAKNQMDYLESLPPQQFKNEAKRLIAETNVGMTLAGLMYAQIVDAKEIYQSNDASRAVSAAQNLGLMPYIYSETSRSGGYNINGNKYQVETTSRSQGFVGQHSNSAYDRLFNPNYSVGGDFKFKFKPRFTPSSQENMR